MAADFLYPTERFLLVGKIAKPHGIRGEVKIYSYSEQPENLLNYKTLTLVTREGQRSKAIAVKKSRVQGKFCVVTLDTVDTRNGAEKLHGMGVLVNKDDLPQPDQSEFYLYQLQGLAVHTRQGEKLGVIRNIFSNGAQDVMIIGDDSHEYMVPIVDSIFIEQTEEKVVIDPPPGLLEINAEK